MILIADGGGTKTSWCYIKTETEKYYFETEGYHPFFVDANYIGQSLKTQLPPKVLEEAAAIPSVFLYSAGGGYADASDGILIAGIGQVFQNAQVVIETDLIAAARALLTHHPGMAAILGTGCNSCVYDGVHITANIESLGFYLGDEGSGAYMGKKLIGDYIRNYMPETISQLFKERFKLSPTELLNAVYQAPAVNTYCASFVPFLKEHLTHPYCDGVVRSALNDFFDNMILRYPNYTQYSFNSVGSIGYYFKEVLLEVVLQKGMVLGKVLPTALEGLVAYHQPEMAGLKMEDEA